MIEEELKALSIEGRQFEKEALPGQGFDGPVQVKALEAVRRGQEGLDTAGGDAATYNGQQPTPTFILCP
jgi:hypothetical protein